MVQGGRHGSLGAFVAHTEQAKMESTAMMTKHEGRISKLDEAMVKSNEALTKSNEMMQNMILAIGSNGQQTKLLTGRIDEIGEKTDRTIAALEKAGMIFPPAAPPAKQQTHGVAPAAAPASAPAPAAAPAPASGATKPPAQNPWMAAKSGGGSGGGRKRGAGRGMGGAVAEYCDGLEDDGDDEHTVRSPSIVERTRSSIARRIAAVRLLVSGGGPVGDLGAADTDVECEAAVGTELGWAEYIKQQYDVGD